MLSTPSADVYNSNSSQDNFRSRLTTSILKFFKQLFRRKAMIDIQIEIDTQNELSRKVNWIELTAIGLGATIGVGIFVLSGVAAAKYCGPSVILSFILSGIVALLSALSFSELATMMSHSGSIFTYTYAALGGMSQTRSHNVSPSFPSIALEYLAWFIGWNAALLYLFGVVTVSVAWSKYIVLFIDLVSNYSVRSVVVEAPIAWDEDGERFLVTHQAINLPAIAVIAFITILLFIGIHETSIVNLVLVAIKVVVLLLFIFICCGYVNRNNYVPFFPPNKDSFSEYGVTGMLQASTYVFFAYVGFDSISNVAQEAKSPETTIPIATIGTVVISLLLYVGVSTVMIGLVSFTTLDSNNPLADAIQATPYGHWLKVITTLTAIISITTVALSVMLSQTRMLYAMAHDGLLPVIFAKVHPERKTPWVSIVCNGIFCAFFAGICPVDILGETTSIGALITYIFVHVSVIVMRYTHSYMPRGFKVPFGPWILPTTGCLLSVLLMKGVSKTTVYRFLVWTALGQIVYFSFGFRCSKQRHAQQNDLLNNRGLRQLVHAESENVGEANNDGLTLDTTNSINQQTV